MVKNEAELELLYSSKPPSQAQSSIDETCQSRLVFTHRPFPTKKRGVKKGILSPTDQILKLASP